MKLGSDDTTTIKENEVYYPTDDQKPNASKETAGKGSYIAKKSASYTTEVISDRDVWCEYLAVVEMVIPGNTGAKNTQPMYELQIKSLFESTHTGKRSWDEPPSGATTIQYATDEERTRAKNDMVILQTTTPSYVPNEMTTVQSYTSDAQRCKESPRKDSRLSRLGNVFKKLKGRKKKIETSDGSGFSGIPPKTNEKKNYTALKEKHDLNAQILALEKFKSAAATKSSLDEKSAIAMAKALSLSERESDSAAERDNEMMMQNIIYESKSPNYSGGTGLAYGKIPHDNLEEGEYAGDDNYLEEISNSISEVPEEKSGYVYDSDIKNLEAKADGDSKMPAVKTDEESWGKSIM